MLFVWKTICVVNFVDGIWMLNLATESSKMDGSVDRSLCEKLSLQIE